MKSKAVRIVFEKKEHSLSFKPLEGGKVPKDFGTKITDRSKRVANAFSVQSR